MSSLTNSFLDYLTPGELDFYNSYSPRMSVNLTEAQKKTMRSIVSKRTRWCYDKIFIRASALGIARTAGAKGQKEYKRICDKLYEAWVWGKTH